MRSFGSPPKWGSLRTAAVHAAAGFTLIELIVVMLLIGMLSAVAAPRFFATADFHGPAFAHELAAAARYARTLAVASGCPVRLVLPDAAHYALRQSQSHCDEVYTREVAHPAGGGAFAARAPDGVTIGPAAFPLTVTFDARGVPEELAADLILPVGGEELRIVSGSGYVELQ